MLCCYDISSPQIYKLDKMYLPPSGLHPLLSCLASKPLLANSASSLTKRYFASVALFRKTIVTRRANLNTIFNTVFDDYMKTSSCFSSIFWLVSGTFLLECQEIDFAHKDWYVFYSYWFSAIKSRFYYHCRKSIFMTQNKQFQFQ